MKYLELYNKFNNKSYFFGKRDGPEYMGKYIYLTDDLGYAGSYASKKPPTVYEFTLKFDESKIFSLNNYLHRKKLSEIVNDDVIDSIMKTKDIEMDWASLSNISNETDDSPEDILESLGFKAVKLRERPNIYSILVFDTDNIKFVKKIDMQTPEMIDFMSKWYKEKEKEWNI